MTAVDAETKLIEKLRLIEALFAGAATPGEKEAAANARDRIQDRLKACEQVDKPVEYKFTLADVWSRRLFLALLRRYGIQPYRRPRQRRTTVMARVPESFVDDILWPQFKELSDTLHDYLSEVTDRVIREGIDSDPSEAEVLEQSPLPF